MKKKYKICFIASHFPQGGAERQICELIKGVITKYEISLILYQSPEVFYQELLSLPIKFYTNNKALKGNKLQRWVNNILFMRSSLLRIKPDIIHTFLFHNGLIVRMFSPSAFKGRILYSVRNSYSDASTLFKISDRLLAKTSYNIFNSSKSLNEFKNMSGSRGKLGLIYNGFDTSRFVYGNTSFKGILNIGNIGRLTYQKNQIQILEALKKLEGKLSYHLDVIGDPDFDQGEKLRSFVQEKQMLHMVKLVGKTNKVEDYYKKFHLFILSSYYEGCPNVLFEAMLCGCLCIISEGANSDKFVIHEKNGLVYDGSIADLMDKILKAKNLLENGKSKSITENGRSYVEKQFSLESMIFSYSKIYSIMLNETAS